MTSSYVNGPSDRLLAQAWQRHLTTEDQGVVAAGDYGRPTELGAHPALVLVDFQHAYLGDDRPILDQLASWPSGGGHDAWAALRTTLPVLTAARAARIPVILSRIAYPAQDSATNPFVRKRGNGAAFVLGSRGVELAAEIEPSASDHLVTKTAASAFHGTDLDQILEAAAADTLLVTGLSTSGCVRATVVDAASRGYAVAVLSDCVADRIRASHELALFDIWLKYGAVHQASEALQYLRSPSEQQSC